MERLIEISNAIVSRMNLKYHRYLYDSIAWNDRMIGIAGPRGVGKTTLALQRIKNSGNRSKTLYVVADDIYFADHTILDTAQRLQQLGYTHLYIDEIHKYPQWSRELKLIYDYCPQLNIVFTASSVLDILKGEADLSRRAIVYHMQGLSLREYLAMYHGITLDPLTLDDITTGRNIPDITQHYPLKLFAQYLQTGYYPFSREPGFDMRLSQIVNATLETDIPIYAGMNASVGKKLKHLLAIVARSVPFKPNYVKIAQEIDVNRALVKDYILYMERAGLIMQLYDNTKGIRALGKVEKIYVDNPNLMYHLANHRPDEGNMRETFFANQMRVAHNITSSPAADFIVDGLTFEIGGRNKGRRQIENLTDAFVVKDNIEQWQPGAIPLWLFGLTY